MPLSIAEIRLKDREPRMPAQPAFGMFSIDTRLVVRTWDPWIAAISRVAPEHALNRPLTEVIPDLEPRGLLGLLRGALERGAVEVLAPAIHEYLIACPPPSRRAASSGCSSASRSVRSAMTDASPVCSSASRT